MATPSTAFHSDIEVRPAARRAVLVLAGLLFAVGTVGSNIGPAWVDERPAVVLAMSARNRNLLGSVPFIDLVPFALLGFGRLMLAGVTLYFLGKWYGAKAIEWTEGQVGELPAIYGWFQRAIDRGGWLMLILMTPLLAALKIVSPVYVLCELSVIDPAPPEEPAAKASPDVPLMIAVEASVRALPLVAPSVVSELLLLLIAPVIRLPVFVETSAA